MKNTKTLDVIKGESQRRIRVPDLEGRKGKKSKEKWRKETEWKKRWREALEDRMEGRSG